jgi:hypothetical protein
MYMYMYVYMYMYMYVDNPHLTGSNGRTLPRIPTETVV